MLPGKDLEIRPTGFRATSRAAALFVSTSPSAEITIRSRGLSPAFAFVTRAPLPSHSFAQRPGSLRSNWSQGSSALLSTSSVMMRLVARFAIASGTLSLVYEACGAGADFLRWSISQGLATISLHLATSFFGNGGILVIDEPFVPLRVVPELPLPKPQAEPMRAPSSASC